MFASVDDEKQFPARAADAAVTRTLRDLALAGPVALRIRGSSMLPRLREGDRVELRARRFYLPGDIVAFRGLDGRLLVHRVVGFRLRHGRVELVAKGDAAARSDAPIPLSSVIGRAANVRVNWRERASALSAFAGIAFQSFRQRVLRRTVR
jgi:hypothetical protein